MAEKISLEGLNKADVLAALYNSSKPQGLGFLQFENKPMTREEAEELLKKWTYFDYLKGRVMKVDLSKDDLDPWDYDRDNGPGAARRAIDELRATGNINSSAMQGTHKVNTQLAGNEVIARLERSKTYLQSGTGEDVDIVIIGLDDMEEHLRPAVERAISEDNNEGGS